jgi:hypothetical protein
MGPSRQIDGPLKRVDTASIFFQYNFKLSSFVMRGFTPIVTLLAASAALVSAGAQGNLHVKAAKYAKRSVAPIAMKDAPRTRSTSMYLNDNTASKLILALEDCIFMHQQSLRSMGVRFLTSTSILANHMQEPFQ